MSVFNRRSSISSGFGGILAEVAHNASVKPKYEAMPSPYAFSALDKLFIGAMCLASVSFCTFAILTSIDDPDYFSKKLISSLLRSDVDPINTGVIATGPSTENALPVPIIARATPLKPSDYQIVVVFDGEAILATNDELMRVKVGSVLPGLGTVTDIVPGETGGGTVAAENATLKSVAQ